MIVELGNKFINLDKIWHAKTVTNEGVEEVCVWFDNSLPVIFRHNDAKKLLKILSKDEVRPIRHKRKKSRITDSELEDVSQMSFKEIQERGLTLGEYQDALSKSEFGR